MIQCEPTYKVYQEALNKQKKNKVTKDKKKQRKLDQIAELVKQTVEICPKEETLEFINNVDQVRELLKEFPDFQQEDHISQDQKVIVTLSEGNLQ